MIQGGAVADAGGLVVGAYVPAHIITVVTTISTLVGVSTYLPVTLLLATLIAHPMTWF